jgi:hypothetical protein
LGEHAVDRIGQIDSRVISWYDDTHAGHHLQTSSGSSASLRTGSAAMPASTD